MKICVITPVYWLSGVALAQVRFARALAVAGHQVDLIVGRVYEEYTMPEIKNVSVTVLDKSRVIYMLPSVVYYLKRDRPEIVFSAEDHLNGIVLLAAIISKSKAKISCSSRVTPFDTYSDVPFTKRWILNNSCD